MAITILNALALLEARRDGVDFERTLTLGRLECFLTPRDLDRVVRLMPADGPFVAAVMRGAPPKFAEPFFLAMGASAVESIDASDFEGATIVHDLNEPFPVALRSRFTAVVDAGTLEHVFNIPMAFKSAMEAVRVGGHFLAALPANNFCGHGFYQFGAELFFQLFSEANGFRLERLLVAPAYAGGRWLDGPAFEVIDPRQTGGRVEIVGRRKMMFLVRARKIAERDVLARWPQQAGYANAWSQDARKSSAAAADTAKRSAFMPIARTLAIRAGSPRRVLERFIERRRWRRQCADNPALKPYSWKD